MGSENRKKPRPPEDGGENLPVPYSQEEKEGALERVQRGELGPTGEGAVSPDPVSLAQAEFIHEQMYEYKRNQEHYRGLCSNLVEAVKGWEAPCRNWGFGGVGATVLVSLFTQNGGLAPLGWVCGAVAVSPYVLRLLIIFLGPLAQRFMGSKK